VHKQRLRRPTRGFRSMSPRSTRIAWPPPGGTVAADSSFLSAAANPATTSGVIVIFGERGRGLLPNAAGIGSRVTRGKTPMTLPPPQSRSRRLAQQLGPLFITISDGPQNDDAVWNIRSLTSRL
jgi:hypothetical protein